MFDALVVSLLVIGLAAGAIGALSAWYESRSFRVRGLPPLIVIPQPVTPVEPMVGAVTSPRPANPETVPLQRPVSPRLSALEPWYEIIRELGHGETSVVYLARERAKNEEVAIKLIRSKYLGDEEAMGRFAREAGFLARLVHPNIVRVRAVLELGDAGLVIVMPYVPGRTLKELIRKEGRVAPDRAERFTRDIAGALGAAHAMGIVHRDVKPENVFVDSDDRALLADFGLARSMIDDAQLTLAGVAIGTPAYMAPEQIDGTSLDARVDVYSLGLLAWEMLSGRRPWEGESLDAVLHHQRHDQLPDVRDLRDDVPGLFADTIAVAIEKNPEMRWQNIGQMIERLDGSAPLQRTAQRPTLSADTVRFTRPSPRAAHIDIVSAAFESDAAELEALDKQLASKTRRRYVLTMGGVAAVMALAALVALAAVAGNVRVHYVDLRPAPPPSGFAVSDSAGGSLQATPSRKEARKTDASGPSSSSVTLAAGGLYSCMVNAEGRVYCWGANERGQLGAGGASSHYSSIAVGWNFTCALDGGRAFCWGYNLDGQLGDGSRVNRTRPVHVEPRPEK